MVRNCRRFSRVARNASTARLAAHRDLPDAGRASRPSGAPAAFAWRRHVDALAGAEREGADRRAGSARRNSRPYIASPDWRRESRNPTPARAGRVGGEPMDRKGRERGGGRDEQEHQQAVVGAAASAIGAIDSQGIADCSGIRGAERGASRRAPARRSRAPGKMPASRQRAARHAHRGDEHRSTSSRRLRRLGRPRPSEKGDAEDAHEAGGGERGDEREHGADGRRQDLQRPLRQAAGLSRIACSISHSDAKPLSGGSAEIAAAADQHEQSRSPACG